MSGLRPALLLLSAGGVTGARVQSFKSLPRANRRQLTVVAAGTPYPSKDWIARNPIVLVAAFLGWTIPASIPSNIYPSGLFGTFCAQIGTELAQWPKGPEITSPFWSLLLAYHVGLFFVMTFGQIGYGMRIKGFFKTD